MYECEGSRQRRMRKGNAVRIAILGLAFTFGAAAVGGANTLLTNKVADLLHHLLAVITI